MSDVERFAELRGQAGKRKTAIDLDDDTEEDADNLLQPRESDAQEHPKRLRSEEEVPEAPACAREADATLSSVQVDAESRRRDAIARILRTNRTGQEAQAQQTEHKQLGLRQFFAPVAKARPQSEETLLSDLEDGSDDDVQCFDAAAPEPSSSSSSPFRPPSGAAAATCQSLCTSSDLELALALQMEDDDPESLPTLSIERPRPAQRRRGNNLMQRLASMDRDFTPEDYELLSGLDAAAPGSAAAPGRSGKEARAERKLLLDRFPKIILDKSSAGGECAICLEKMKPRMEARRLPCLHMFHRRCIDRWLLASDKPRCPVDQGALDLDI
eukprot:TRINITY_DN59832_c0_g1_i1.p1 TRINITY_DN59832_c0_g1~~TRINITY_DN59832_c0_g1_i1.p1  ORF type:complete len:328 (+),score=77.93 TRINITY_DN59832_c0_g1_i1:144-1127(+)